jgi:hypothetical protein
MRKSHLEPEVVLDVFDEPAQARLRGQGACTASPVWE